MWLIQIDLLKTHSIYHPKLLKGIQRIIKGNGKNMKKKVSWQHSLSKAIKWEVAKSRGNVFSSLFNLYYSRLPSFYTLWGWIRCSDKDDKDEEQQALI